jgi:hypothetical protein
VAMKEADVRTLFLSKFGVRLDEEMCQYVVRRLKDGQPIHACEESLAVMGGHARTGNPVRYFAPVRDLSATKSHA